MTETPERYERYIDIRLKVTVETETYTLDDSVYEDSYVVNIVPVVTGSTLNSIHAVDLATSLMGTDRYQEMLSTEIPSAIGEYYYE